jgi:hypothetical protein
MMFKSLVLIHIVAGVHFAFGAELGSSIRKLTPTEQWQAGQTYRNTKELSKAKSAYLELESCADIKFRLLAADGLVQCRAFDEAARIYHVILMTSKDIDWIILAASGIADCGVQHKGTAILKLMQVINSSDASQTQKTDAKVYLKELNKALK